MPFQIRPYHPEDLSSLYQICLQTGDGGRDASHLLTDKKLMGHYYAAPYAVLDPEVCFVASHNNEACGYIVGCKSSSLFAQQTAQDWFPKLREQYPLEVEREDSLTDNMLLMIHHGYHARPEFADYPAHLHISLLPNIQRAGLGRKLIVAFINKLKELKIPGVHLEVSRANTGAVSFYEKLGFQAIGEFKHSITYGMKL
ncbi:hypothetical protein GCM10007916_07310 [Psychromonas marina]|uniref:N-acetyltransferase domain-containing protein n=1 Tax=Psychromonas marina TaxID=88364 RepID=A0ABQ6DXE5_9GAMM|nr:N-acetyltransferase [Psychromonas marina]GLS89664.1 hypothetical protein GCM10007916_07310 [Psychromonas marina]